MMARLRQLETHLYRLLFEQPEPLRRLALMRISVGLICIAYVLLEPYSQFLIDTADLLYRPSPLFSFFPPLGRTGLWVLEAAIILTGVLFTLGLATRPSAVLFGTLFTAWNYYVACFTRPTWAYNTYLNFFLLALCLFPCGQALSLDARLGRTRPPVDPLAEQQRASFAMGAMQLFIAVFYFQAGLAKLLSGGLDWFVLGQTPFIQTLETGGWIGRELTRFPWFFTASTLFAGIFEFGFLPLGLVLGRFPRWLGAMSMMFHMGVGLTMNISFWHLFLLYPALFIVWARPATQAEVVEEPRLAVAA